MSEKKLIDAIGGIDETYIEEAETMKQQALAKAELAKGPEKAGTDAAAKRKRLRRFGALAAGLILVSVVGVKAAMDSGMIDLFARNGASGGDMAYMTEESGVEAAGGSAVVDKSEAPADVSGEMPSATAGGEDPYEAEPEDAIAPEPGAPAENAVQGEAFVLTAAEWNDLDNWPFFTNLVNTGTIGFPAFGVDPRFRTKVVLTDSYGDPAPGETVTLLDEAENVLWTAQSGLDGCAYLFCDEGETPAYVSVNGGAPQPLVTEVNEPDDPQGETVVTPTEELYLAVEPEASAPQGLQVMFLIDTTGSMGDELAYLQMDFASIAREAGAAGTSWSVNFYRDEGDDYVTKTNAFTTDAEEAAAQIGAEYADGGGDYPEAVADILRETITENGEWREDCNKIAFLIFDAPPHEGTEAAVAEAVRSAAARGIHLIPVVSSGAERDVELFGRAIAICTNGTYVFLTDDSGVGDSHLEPIVGDYTVELLHDVIVRIIGEYQ